MAELQKRVEKLLLRLDHMGLRVEQSVTDAVRALQEENVQAGLQIDDEDNLIDHEEVEIERECIRLLALYQPTAVDLRTICMVIKVNNDLERIADKAAGIGKRVKLFANNEHIQLEEYPGFEILTRHTLDQLRKTVELLNGNDVNSAKNVIEFDETVNKTYRNLVRSVLDREDNQPHGIESALNLILLARAFERIADHCVNIAEDIVFLKTGDIIRHQESNELNRYENDERPS